MKVGTTGELQRRKSEKSLANHLMGGTPLLGVTRTIMVKVVNRSPRWAYAVGGDLLAELDRVSEALGLDRPDTAKQALQAGLALLAENRDNVPSQSTTSGPKADEVRYPEGWTGKMLTANIDPAGIEIVDSTYGQNGPAAPPTSPADELSSSAPSSAPGQDEVETVARLLREQGFTEATAELDGTGKLTLRGPIPDNPFESEPHVEAFWAAADRVRAELRQAADS
jgi:hypothetical protein